MPGALMGRYGRGTRGRCSLSWRRPVAVGGGEIEEEVLEVLEGSSPRPLTGAAGRCHPL